MIIFFWLTVFIPLINITSHLFYAYVFLKIIEFVPESRERGGRGPEIFSCLVVGRSREWLEWRFCRVLYFLPNPLAKGIE